MTKATTLLLFCLMALLTVNAQADDTPIEWPADSGVINVREHGVKGDGVTDDTAALQQIMDRYPNGFVIVYLPPGEYLISDTITWPDGPRGWAFKNVSLHGAGPAHTKIKLKDNCPGFGDPAAPKAMIWTGQAAAQRFGINVRDLTLDTGDDNPGAIGAQYMANNTGTMRNVVIRSGMPHGVHGLDMRYTTEIGPLLIKDVTIHGFQHGIRTGTGINGQAFEDVTVRGQLRYGWYNTGQPVYARKFVSHNSVPAIRHDGGIMVLLDSDLRGEGQASSLPAVVQVNHAELLVRNLTTSGYAAAIEQFQLREGETLEAHKHPENIDLAMDMSRFERVGAVPGPNVDEWLSGDPITLFSIEATPPLQLPVHETPEPDWKRDFETWANVEDYGATVSNSPGDADDTRAIQAALDSGATTVYFPNRGEAAYPKPSGGYTVTDTLYVSGPVRQLIGCEATMSGEPYWIPADIVIEDGDSPVVFIENLEIGTLTLNTDRTVVIRHSTVKTITRNGPGDLFLEDVVGHFGVVKPGQRVWARQLNTEPVKKAPGVPHILNDGGMLWILGLKTEGGGTIVKTINGGQTEVLGTHIYTNHNQGRQHEPLLVVDNASLNYFGSEVQFIGPHESYKVYIRETQDGRTREILPDALPHNYGWGKNIPMYVARGPDPAPTVDMPRFDRSAVLEAEITVDDGDGVATPVGFLPGLEIAEAVDLRVQQSNPHWYATGTLLRFDIASLQDSDAILIENATIRLALSQAEGPSMQVKVYGINDDVVGQHFDSNGPVTIGLEKIDQIARDLGDIDVVPGDGAVEIKTRDLSRWLRMDTDGLVTIVLVPADGLQGHGHIILQSDPSSMEESLATLSLMYLKASSQDDAQP